MVLLSERAQRHWLRPVRPVAERPYVEKIKGRAPRGGTRLDHKNKMTGSVEGSPFHTRETKKHAGAKM